MSTYSVTVVNAETLTEGERHRRLSRVAAISQGARYVRQYAGQEYYVQVVEEFTDRLMINWDTVDGEQTINRF